MKVCKTCKEKLSDDAFYIRRKLDGYTRLHSSCKSCVLLYNKDRYKNTPGVKEAKQEQHARKRDNPEFVAMSKERSSKFYQSVSGRAKTLWKSALRRTKDIDNFDITSEWIEKRISKGLCEITGLVFDFSPHPVYVKNPYSPSIDRIDSSKDYTKDNVRFVIWQVNLMRGEISDDEILEICSKFIEGIKNGRQKMDI